MRQGQAFDREKGALTGEKIAIHRVEGTNKGMLAGVVSILLL